MNQLRSVGAFMIAASILCFLMAYERHATHVATAKAVMEQLDGIEFESVAYPVETYVCAFIGMVLLVAGVRCIGTWRATRQQESEEQPLLTE